ncbi:hypothetical protein AYX15_07152 [Cryptococcus neoformans]|nr:hypothetical protein AYX15_07152 [Cryptococcus neoformans var. grubii]
MSTRRRVESREVGVNRSTWPSPFNFFLKTHFTPIAFLPFGRLVSSHTSLSFMTFNSSSMALCQSIQSAATNASFAVLGSSPTADVT